VKLGKRERMSLYVLLAVVSVMAAYRLVLADRVGEMASLHEGVPKKRSDLEMVQRISQAHLRRRSEADALRAKIESRGGEFDPFVFLKNVAQSAGLKDRHEITLQKLRVPKGSEFTPQGWIVELTGVSQIEIGEFLRRVYEADKLLLVSEFTIEPEKKVAGLHANMKIVTLLAE